MYICLFAKLSPMGNLETKWKIKFYLEKRKSDNSADNQKSKSPIYMYVTFGKGQRMQFYTGEMVYADQIDSKYLEKVRDDRNHFRPVKSQVTDSTAINNRLEGIAMEAKRIIEYADKSDPPIELTAVYIKDALKAWVDKDFNPNKKSKGILLSQALDEYVSYSLLHNAPKTVAGFKQVRDNVELYIKSTRANDVGLNDINQAFIDGFEAFLINKTIISKNPKKDSVPRHLSNNTYAKNLKVLRAFLKWCSTKDWYQGNVKISYKENEGPIHFLTIDEFRQLETAKFRNETHERMRDVFIFGVLTGLRYGDLKKLKKNDFRDGKIWFFEQKKNATRERSIKLVPKALEIVQRYKDWPGAALLPAYADPNRVLKEVFVLARIEREVTIKKKFAGGRTEESIVPLSKLAHSHMGRKTFITLALSMGMPEVVVKSITGHSKDSESFRRYYEIIDSMKDDAMDSTFGKL